MEIGYITTRELENSSGKINGKIRVIVPKGESSASVDLTCPECGFNQKKKEEWSIPFNTECDKCGYKIKLQSLKKEIKKKKGIK
jgi:ribosomal protein L37AE/L43A